jgi:hypothetical protein
MADPWTVPSKNDARLRYAERCAVAIRRTMRGCDRPDESPSTGIDHPISRHRRSQAFYNQSYSPSRQGQNLPASGRSVPKVRPKGQVETSLVHGVTTVARPGDVERMRMPRHRSGKARLMLPPWHRPGEVKLMFRHGIGQAKLSCCYLCGIGQARLNRCYLRGIGLARLRCCYCRGQPGNGQLDR